ncbi:hypothetical protein DsansV1_C07g0074411 [Dioscorea sansibarensis]
MAAHRRKLHQLPSPAPEQCYLSPEPHNRKRRMKIRGLLGSKTLRPRRWRACHLRHRRT